MDLTDRFWIKVDIGEPDECWPWMANSSGGYGLFKMPNGKSGGRQVHAHRMAYDLTYGPPETTPSDYDHLCDNPTCCNPRHIEPVGHVENMKRMWRRGRGVHVRHRGSANGRAKLTLEQVERARDKSIPAKHLAAEYGVDVSQIYSIRSGRTWAKGEGHHRT